jgi:hypothetical protein
MAIINQQQLQVLLVNNQIVPNEGPKAVPLFLNFAAATDFTLDMTEFQERKFLEMVQTIYVDCSLSASDLTVTFGKSNQKIVAKAGTQGYYPVLVPNFTSIDFSSAGGVLIPVFLVNVPIPGLVWPDAGGCDCPDALELVGLAGVSQAYEKRINFIDGSNVTITMADNPGTNSTDVTIASSGGGGGTPGGSSTQKQYNNAGAFGGLIGTSIIPQASAWTVINNANLVIDDFSTDFMGLHLPSHGSIALSGLFQNLGSSTSYTIVARFVITAINQPGSTGDLECNLTITDGTKFITFEVLNDAGSTQNPLLRITTYSSFNTQVASIHGPTIDLVGNIVTLKIVGDAVHRTYSYWSSGAWVQYYQEAIGTFLTETQGGLTLANLNAINIAASMDVMFNYWANTTP